MPCDAETRSFTSRIIAALAALALMLIYVVSYVNHKNDDPSARCRGAIFCGISEDRSTAGTGNGCELL